MSSPHYDQDAPEEVQVVDENVLVLETGDDDERRLDETKVSEVDEGKGLGESPKRSRFDLPHVRLETKESDWQLEPARREENTTGVEKSEDLRR